MTVGRMLEFLLKNEKDRKRKKRKKKRKKARISSQIVNLPLKNKY